MSTPPRRHVDEFRWLRGTVRIESTRPHLHALLRRQWGDVLPGSGGGAGPVRSYRIRGGSGGRVVLDGPFGSAPLDPDLIEFHAYNRIVSDLLGRESDHFVLHGTAVALEDRALLLSGPSSFGKSTLGMHLATRGFSWVADDVALLDRTSGRLVPFDRPLRVRPGARRTLSAEDRARARRARIDVEHEDWIVRPSAWFGTVTGPVPVSTVVLLRPVADGASVRRFPSFVLRLLRGRERLVEELARLPGIAEVRRSDADPLLLELRSERPAALTAWLADHGDDLVFSSKYASRPATFDGAPVLTPIPRFQAALELCQELQNRHPGSLLAEEYADRALDLVADVAERLSGTSCFALTPGRLDEALRLLTGCFE